MLKRLAAVAACGGGLCTLTVQGRRPWSRRRFGLRGNFGRIERPLNSIEIIHSAKYLYRGALFSRREGWRERRRAWGGEEDIPEVWRTKSRKGRKKGKSGSCSPNTNIRIHRRRSPWNSPVAVVPESAHVGIVREPRFRVPCRGVRLVKNRWIDRRTDDHRGSRGSRKIHVKSPTRRARERPTRKVRQSVSSTKFGTTSRGHVKAAVRS